VYGDIKGEGERTPGSAVATLVALRYLLAAFALNRGDKFPVNGFDLYSFHRLSLCYQGLNGLNCFINYKGTINIKMKIVAVKYRFPHKHRTLYDPYSVCQAELSEREAEDASIVQAGLS
jgi:hypothetical protein